MSGLALVENKLIIKEAGLPLRAGSSLREADGGQRREVVVISEGWGSSGYYGSEMLERDVPRIFPIGTHMYLNHPTEREDRERPERSVADLVGKLLTTPRLAGIDMVAEALIYSHWVEVIEALAEDIGLSIRAYGIAEDGDAGGRHGPIIKALTQGHSIDYVTKAGAGGKIGQKIEAARSCPMQEELASDLSQSLRNAGRERWGSKSTYVYVDDYDIDEMWVVFCISPDYEDMKYIRINFERTGDDVELVGEPENVERTTSYKPSTEAVREDGPGSGAGNKQEEAAMADDTQLTELQESVRKLEEKQAENDKKVEEAETKTQEANDRADRAEEALRLSRANTVAREAVKEKFPKLPESAQTRAVESALRDKLPLDESKKLDESAFKSRAEKAAEDEANYLAEAGGGEVSDFGASESEDRKDNPPEGSKALKEAEERLQKRFEAEGMSEAAAKAAAEGR